MGDNVLRCPLCCDRTFESKSELVEHLAIIYESITCPICNNKWSSVSLLLQHLTLDNCHAEKTVDTISFDVTESQNNQPDVENTNQNFNIAEMRQPVNVPQEELPDQNSTIINDAEDMGRVYVDFLSKQLTKPCLQTQELKLVKDDGGVSRYVFMFDEAEDNGSAAAMDVENAVVTKQNNDGTISLTTVRDMKMETVDPLISQEPEVEEAQEEIYSCNTCGVSFTSVLEHIQNYHNDQDVVVEETIDEMETEPNEASADPPLGPLTTEVMSTGKQDSRRMITDTGDIVETPVLPKTESNAGLEVQRSPPQPVAKIANRRFVVIDSVVKEIKQPKDKVGPYHKVVIKEITRPNGENIKIFNCMACHVFVSTLEAFKKYPCKQCKYSCPHCPVTYENCKSLCAHMKVHKTKATIEASPPKTLFTCETCNTVFLTNKSLKLHKRMHDPIKSRPIEPPVETADGLEVSRDKFLCSVCNKLIPIDYRAVHQKSHKTKPGLSCEICNKEFLSQEYLEMHMNVHLSDKAPTNRQDGRSLPYTCVYCDRRFSRPHEKVKHERIHTGEKPHSCEICGKSFRVSYCLTLHMRTHTGARPYSCQHCGKRFKAHSVYNHHLMTHSEVRGYKCPYCPKAFKTSVQLAGHKNSHTKPFSCQQCNRPFASLYAVRVHQETHARPNNLKFSCNQCGASYARAFALKDHIKLAHNKIATIDNQASTTATALHKEPIVVMTGISDNWVGKNEEENASGEITIDGKEVKTINENGDWTVNNVEEIADGEIINDDKKLRHELSIAHTQNEINAVDQSNAFPSELIIS